MIRQDFFIDKFGWNVVAFYDVKPKDANIVLKELRMLASASETRMIEEFISEGNYNTGFTYSNPTLKASVVSIGETTDARQFYNTLQHEQRHLETHIAKAYNLDPYGEELCYLAGDIAMSMFSACRELLCDCCRKKYRLPLYR